jgi:imidazole glycerol-phosphate synthase subunit HisH
MRSVTLVDSGLSNIDSAVRAIEYCGGDPIVSRDPTVIAKAGRLIMPGVGAFPVAMHRLTSLGLTDAIRQSVIHAQRPMLGICLGMQLLASLGHEHEICAGLDLIEGSIVPLKSNHATERIPHIGWNTVEDDGSCPLLKGIPPNSDFYFVHSFCFQARDFSKILGRTPSFGSFASIVGSGQVFGTQFHPEKSQTAGFALLKNFLQM